VGKQLCVEQGITVSKMNMNMAYLGRVCKNTHMIIAMSPLAGEFRTRIRQFPSLVTCCTLDWFNEWPEEALLGVGKGQILATDVDLGTDLDNCVEVFKSVH
jgi:dynein heavy chain